MSTLKLTGSSSGSTSLTAPASGSNRAIAFPDAAGTVALTSDITGADHTPAFQATQSGGQTIGTGAYTKISLNSEVFDSDSAFDHSTNYRFTVPSGEGGKYWFAYCIGFGYGLDDNEIIQGQLYKNGSDEAMTQSMYRSPSGSGYSPSAVNCSGILTLAASDYIELYVYHNEGGDMTSSASRTFLAMHKLQGL